MSTSSRLLTFKLLIAASCAWSGQQGVAAAPTEPGSKDPYDLYIDDERALASSEHTGEIIASGAAAVIIGIYGYYNTSPNPLVKLLYAATQTAGVLTMGQAIRNQNSPRLTLEIDDLLRKSADGETVNVRDLRARIGQFKDKTAAAEAKTLAYTSGILSGLYFYNGFREKGADHTLRNVYYFLGFNFALGSAVGAYRSFVVKGRTSQVTLEIGPVSTITYAF